MNNPTNMTPDATAETLDDVIKSLVEMVIPSMEPDVKYTLEMILGGEVWKSTDDSGAHIVMGMSMSHLVKKNYLPQLEFAGKTSANTNLYRLK